MALKITHKHGTTAGTPPAAGDIDVGEIAINAADAEIYTKDTSGNVRKFQNTTTGTAAGVQFTQSGTGAVPRTVESKLQDVVSVKDFGAVGDGVTDDTDAIQAAVDALQGSDTTLYFPSGNYLLSRRGGINIFNSPDEPHYCILITDKLSIKCDGTFKFPTRVKSSMANAFVFNDVTDGSFTGGKFISNDSSVDTGSQKRIYDGCGVIMQRCINGIIAGIYGENVISTALLVFCESCQIRYCVNSKQQFNPYMHTGCGFCIYGGNCNTINTCKTYGGGDDGDIGCYGTGRFNEIFNCTLLNYEKGDSSKSYKYNSQGICIDAGQCDATVQSNYVEGYFYGIDVKSYISNALVSGNTAYACKVGITCRKGELDGGVPNMGVTIDGNLIIPAFGMGRNTDLVGFKQMGIFIQDCPQAVIKNNTLTVSYRDPNIISGGTTQTQSWIGVLVRNENTVNAAKTGTVTIHNNTFNYAQTLGGITAYNGGPFIHCIARVGDSTGRDYISISNNSFMMRSEATIGKQFFFHNNRSVVFHNNSITPTGGTTEPTDYLIVCDSTQFTTISNNQFFGQAGVVRHFGGGQQLEFSHNNLDAGRVGVGNVWNAIVKIDGANSVMMMGNFRFRSASSLQPNMDGILLQWINSSYTDPCLTSIGNTLRGAPCRKDNYYSIDGVVTPTGTNILVSDNVSTGAPLS
jgi:hypothetical protein